MTLSRRTTTALLIALLATSGFARQVQAVAPIPTEFPAARDITPPQNMSEAAKGRWEERLARLATRADPAGVANDLGALPVIERAFTSLAESVDQLDQARDSLPGHLRTSWIIPVDVSAGPLGRCDLQFTTPSGAEEEAKLTGLIRVYRCPAQGPVLLSESLLRKGGMVNLVSVEQVNVRMAAGGIPRGIIARRLVNPEGGQEMTLVQWRSGEKLLTLEVAGTQAPALDFVKRTLDSIPD
jgi:hypothetical protein